MAQRTSKTSAKVARKAAVKRGAAKVSKRPRKPTRTVPTLQTRKVAKPRLLTGGNPQIAKAYGDAPGHPRPALLEHLRPQCGDEAAHDGSSVSRAVNRMK